MTTELNIVYFAWVRERLGRDEEVVHLPDTVTTIGQLVTHLQSLGTVYSEIFEDVGKLRFALDQEFVSLDHCLQGAKELAIFPPVTGG
ncbi:MAG: molybdopterin converting factor subunit 1 [Parasphingorhabdus sp.]|uniref:molybdopterin converting factor subunit 1 n=1 Tax=Parasphingorhabdus sp. TaxID=2709688 RepID=UPI0032972CBB